MPFLLIVTDKFLSPWLSELIITLLGMQFLLRIVPRPYLSGPGIVPAIIHQPYFNPQKILSHAYSFGYQYDILTSRIYLFTRTTEV